MRAANVSACCPLVERLATAVASAASIAKPSTARVIADHQYALVTDAYLNDADTRAFLRRHNPHALHSICERLLEAMQRGLWQTPGDYRAQVEQHLLASEQQIEGMQT